MKTLIQESIDIPSGVSCEFTDNVFKCKKGSLELSRIIRIPRIELKLEQDKITFTSKKANKNQLKTITSNLTHIKNLFSGLDEKYSYTLEACNVHFPMTLKVDKGKLVINNFLGEKTPRLAVILPGVDVEIKGQKVTVSSHNKESAGQTTANIEKATKVRNRDRRVFQDGIFLVARPGEAQ